MCSRNLEKHAVQEVTNVLLRHSKRNLIDQRSQIRLRDADDYVGFTTFDLWKIFSRQRRQRKSAASALYRCPITLNTDRYIRPIWQSPLDFSRELAKANPNRFNPVISLTEIFYEIRFGHREMDDDRKSRVKEHMRKLEHALLRRGAKV